MKATATLFVALVCGCGASAADTVILADPDDPYYLLAGEIAQQENVQLVQSKEEAFAANPVFLLWVVSPAHLTEEDLASYGMAVRERLSAISLGLITGSTLDSARRLWLRAAEASARRCSYADVRAEEITVPGSDNTAKLPLTAANMQRMLHETDYLLYSGHAGPSSWMGLHSDEVPDLDPIVVSTASCRTFRPWMKGNIALAFVDKGAAAYAGFPSSPSGQYLIGQLGGMPLRHTWPEYPIGHVVQIQARAAMQTFARFPQYFLLGDPRISLGKEAPYEVVEDRLESDQRILTLSGAPAGFIPVRVPGGAGYDFVTVAGVTSASSRDPLFNSRLQMADIGEDKHIMLGQEGGDVRILLRSDATWHWRAGDAFLDLLDLGVLAGPSDAQLAFWVGLLALVLVGWKAIRRHTPVRLAALAAAAGLTLSAAWSLYVYLRRESITITSEVVEIDLLYSTATALLIGCGLLLFLMGRSRWVIVPALLLALFPGWLILVIFPLAILLRAVLTIEPAYASHATVIAQSLRVVLTAAFLAGIFHHVKQRVAPRIIRQG